MMLHRRLKLGCAIGLCLVAWAMPGGAAAAQSSSAAIAGTVRDGSGSVLEGAVVVLRNPDTGAFRQVMSGSGGAYEFAALLPAERFVLNASLDGFRPVQRAVETVTAGERRMVDLRLQLAALNEAIEVTADTSLARTSSPELGGGLGREQMDRVPVNGNDLIALAYLIPGAAPARGFYNLAPRLTINGSSSLVTNYTVDGFDNTDLFLGGPKVPVTIGSTAESRRFWSTPTRRRIRAHRQRRLRRDHAQRIEHADG